MSRPSEKPAWTQGNPAQQTEPTNSEKFGGYSPNQRPDPKKWNWILGNVSDWIDWFDSWSQQGAMPVSNVGHLIATGTTLQAQLDEIDAYLASLGLRQGFLTGTVDGVNSTFQLPGGLLALNAQSCLVFLDQGNEAETLDYNYSVVGGVGTIVFAAGSIPQPGQVPRFVILTANSPGSGGTQITGGFAVYGAQGAGLTIDPTLGVTSTSDQRALIFVKSNGGAQAVTANPQISAGTKVGQELRLVGTSDVDYISLADGNGLSLNGPISLKNKLTIDLWWDGAVWNESDRKQ